MKKTQLRQTYSSGVSRLPDSLKFRPPPEDSPVDQEETLKMLRNSPQRPHRKQLSSQSPRLRSTYSPNSFSSRLLGDSRNTPNEGYQNYGNSGNSNTSSMWRGGRSSGLNSMGSPPKNKLYSVLAPDIGGSTYNNCAAQSTNSFLNNDSNNNFGSFGRQSSMSGVSVHSRGLSKIQSTLNYFEDCVNRAKKQLEDKNNKKFVQPDLITIREEEEQQLHPSQYRSDRHHYNGHDDQKTMDMKATLKIPELSKLVTAAPRPKQAVGFSFNPYSPRNHNIYYVSQLVRAIHEENSLAKDHLKTSMKILRALQKIDIPSFGDIEHRKLNLKKDEKYRDKKTVIFDLDETLIHCNENSELPSDVKLSIKLQSGQLFEAGINIRPYALPLLISLAQKFQLILFTASHSSYANVVIDYLDPEKKIFQHRLSRQHCYLTETGMYVKDLRIINRNPAEMVLIDNAAYSYAFQLENGIPILSFYEGPDFELKALQKYLENILACKDVRELNKKTFKLHHYLKFNSPQELIQQLYIDC